MVDTIDNKFKKIRQIDVFGEDDKSNIYNPVAPLRLPMWNNLSKLIDVAPMFIMLTYNYVRVFLAAWDTVSAAVTNHCGNVLVGPISTDEIVKIEALPTGGDSNMTVKDVVNSFMAFQNSSIEKYNSIETYNKKKDKKTKTKHIGMTYSDLLHLFSCSTVKAVTFKEYKACKLKEAIKACKLKEAIKEYKDGKLKEDKDDTLKISAEELAAYEVRRDVPNELRRHASASRLYAALRAGQLGGGVVDVPTANITGLQTLCEHRLKRTASDADLEEPEAKRSVLDPPLDEYNLLDLII